jgi:hypothetical protein
MINKKVINTFGNILKSDELASIKLLQVNLEKKETLKMKFKQVEINMLNDYCSILGYKLSFNKQKKTAKIFNLETHKFGYVQKINDILYYGYIKQVNSNSQFVKKYSLSDNIKVFKTLLNFSGSNYHLDILKGISGIVELESFK